MKRRKPPSRVEQEVRAARNDLGQLTTRQLLARLLESLYRAERGAYLDTAPDDKGNGAYDRNVNVGSIPVPVSVPRSRRSSAFRPSLPPPFKRGYTDAEHELLLQLATSGRSLGAAREALRGLGVAASEKELESIARHFVEELDLRNTRPIDTDLLALFVDAKYVDVREGDKLRPCCLYVVVGLGRDGKKSVLACQPLLGRESLESWKIVLRGLIDRGLRNVLIVVQDDFPGLLGVTTSLFPRADVQLCIVHMQRNARSHLGKNAGADFNSRMKTIKSAWNPDLAAGQFDDLCRDFEKAAPAFVAELRKKRDHYLAFLRYPEPVRKSFSTTNAVEAVNGQLEILRRNNGGYFHSLDTLKAKVGIAIKRLEDERWRRPAATVSAALVQLESLFVARFEAQ